MANQDIIKFIREQFAAGFSEGQIREALKGKNWPDAEIDAGFAEWKTNPTLPERKDVGRFVGESWGVYKRLLPTFLHIYLQMLYKFLLVSIPGAILFGIGWYLKQSGQMSESPLVGAGTGLLVVYILIYIYMFIWTQVSLLLIIRNRNFALPPNQIIDQARPLIRPYFWTSALTGIMTALWFLLFIIPGIIFGVYYCLAEYITIDKGVSGLEAIKMSKAYVKGIWWPVVTSLLGLGAVSVIIYFPLTYLGQLLGVVAQNIISIGFNLFFVPYSLIYMFLLYERIKALKPEIS
jgi:hypothetical protein